MLIFWVYFLVPLVIGTRIPGFLTMLITLVVYEGAFLSEIIRGGIVALGRGQMEAARSLGHSYLGAMAWVILPQALYNMIPSILSQFVSTIKETTLGYVINVPELTFAANQINNQLLTQPFQVFFILAIIYFVDLLEPDPRRHPPGAPDRQQARRARRRTDAARADRASPHGRAMTATSTGAPAMITFEKVNKKYGDYQALDRHQCRGRSAARWWSFAAPPARASRR